ncbi:MAG: hypothetical protein CVT75_11130 [Alphaproteobacteria bacterium HGW-Alphaproteobacteria-14]|nr:MAG: hypothetical protein CVT75_11130 [Alphaproteobacteria bacterium HGW-Alphaproteobacteria-14]
MAGVKGTILGYNQAENKGAISHSEGARIDFHLESWRGDRAPASGMVVDFEIVDGVASDIYPIAQGPAHLPGAQQGGQDTALLLGIFALVSLAVGYLTSWMWIGFLFLLISAGLGLAAIITGKDQERRTGYTLGMINCGCLVVGTVLSLVIFMIWGAAIMANL